MDVMKVVLDKSDMIEETTLMEMQMKGKINNEKNHLLAQLEEECDYKVPYRHKTMEDFYKGNNCTNFDNKVTESAVELVTAMYWIWEEAQLDNETVAGINKLYDIGRINQSEYYKLMRKHLGLKTKKPDMATTHKHKQNQSICKNLS